MATTTGPVSGAPTSRALRGCRVVTTSMTARVLLANQLRALDEVDWTVVSGDPYDDPPDGVDVEVVPIRREPAFSDFVSLVPDCGAASGATVRFRADPHAQVLLSRTSCQAGRRPGHLHHPRRVFFRQRPKATFWAGCSSDGAAAGPTGCSSRAPRMLTPFRQPTSARGRR